MRTEHLITTPQTPASKQAREIAEALSWCLGFFNCFSVKNNYCVKKFRERVILIYNCFVGNGHDNLMRCEGDTDD